MIDLLNERIIMQKIITKKDLMSLNSKLCLPVTLFDESEIDESNIIEYDSKKYYNLEEPPDLVNLSYGTIKYDSDWHDDFLILI
jgi:hypothetical protein